MVQLIAFLFFCSKSNYSIYDDGDNEDHPGCHNGLVENRNDYTADTQQNDKDFSQSLQKPVDSASFFLGSRKSSGKKISKTLARKKDESAHQQKQDKETIGLWCNGSKFP